MKIDIYMDHVIIEGQTIRRPSYISRGHWMQWWETTTAFKQKYCKYCGMTAKV
jgi:hypothetical protein